jgi:hypothetical protein
VTGCHHRYFQGIAAGLALVAMVALILHGALHIAGHGSELRHLAGHHSHAPTMLAAEKGGEVELPKHDHLAQHPVSGPEPVSGSDGGLCCCTGTSCMSVLLPTGAAAVRYTVSHRVLTMRDRDQQAQFRPDGPRRPPKPRLA